MNSAIKLAVFAAILGLILFSKFAGHILAGMVR